MSDRRDAELARRLGDALERLSARGPVDGFDPSAAAAIVASGLSAAPVPVDAGGLGIGLRDAVEVVAAIGAIDGSTALGLAMHLHVVGAMDRVRGLARRPPERALPEPWPRRGALAQRGVHRGRRLESGAGAVPETRATRRPDGGAAYRLDGEKAWTTWLPVLRYALVAARMDEIRGDGGLGIRTRHPPSACLRRRPGGARCGPPAGLRGLGMRGSASGRLRLEGSACRPIASSCDARAGTPDPRGPASAAWFGLCVAGAYLGVGEGARREVVRWAVDRRPGDGSTAVGDLPTVQVRIGRMDAALRAARIVALDVAGAGTRPSPRIAGTSCATSPWPSSAATNAGRPRDRRGAADRRRARVPDRSARAGVPRRAGRTDQPAPRGRGVPGLRSRASSTGSALGADRQKASDPHGSAVTTTIAARATPSERSSAGAP